MFRSCKTRRAVLVEPRTTDSRKWLCFMVAMLATGAAKMLVAIVTGIIEILIQEIMAVIMRIFMVSNNMK